MEQIQQPMSQPYKPLIVKYVQPYPSGILSQSLARYEIGYILRGKKRIYTGDSYCEAKAGDLFYLNMGTHYVENMPDTDGSFEQIACFYSPAQLSNIILTLSHTMDMVIEPARQSTDGNDNYIICPAWSTLKSFFASVNQYIRCNHLSIDHVAEQIKTTELIYLLMSNTRCGIKDRLLGGIDLTVQNFEHSVRSHIFDNMSIEELASLLNRSMTSFKKEFRTVFGVPPHRWFIAQRLSRAKLLLVSTSKSVSEIGNECAFPNTSHFIKLFKKEFGTTPALYRMQSGQTVASVESAVNFEEAQTAVPSGLSVGRINAKITETIAERTVDNDTVFGKHVAPLQPMLDDVQHRRH